MEADQKPKRPTKGRPRTESTAESSDHVERVRRVVHQRLDDLFREAVSGRFYGRVTIEIDFRDGRPGMIRRRIDGIDK